MKTHVVGTASRVGRALLCIAGGLFIAGSSAQGQRDVTGRVVDADGNAAVPGVAIVAPGTTAGAVSNDSGAFHIRLPVGVATLIARRIGYKPQTVALAADQNDIRIALARDVLELEATVVTGVATTISAQNSANAVSVLNTDQITRVPATTVENAIQGKIPGAVIQQNNGGAPGGGMQVQIRGITSINTNASPLYVVDGVIVNNATVNSGANSITAAGSNTSGVGQDPQDNSPNRIADLNPNDIESIEVLKGSSASAIYGSKAASGVVIITTKKGIAGRAKWALTGRTGSYSLANSLPLRTFPTYASANAWWTHDAHQTTALPTSMYQGPQDYQHQLFGGGTLSGEGDLSVRGATNTTNYFGSLLSKYDNGIELNSGYNKQAIRTNLTQTFAPTFSVSSNLYYQHSVTVRGVTGNDNVGVSPYNVFSTTPQFANLNTKDAAGNYATNPFAAANPFADAQQILTPSTVNRFIGGGTANWQAVTAEKQSLTVSLIAGVDQTGQSDVNYAPPDLQLEQHQSLPGVSNISQANTLYYNYSLSVVHHFTGISFLDATTSVGLSQDYRSLDNPNLVGQDLPLGIRTPAVGVVQTGFELRQETRSQSLYGQEQVLALGQRLSLTGGLTADRNSNNGDFNKYFLYPKVSGAYRIPQFVGFLNELKVRAAYGRSGTAPNYGFRYPASQNYFSFLDGGHALAQGFQGAPVFYVQTDTHITPETNTEIETGFDATLFSSRAQFSATVYQKRVSDLVMLATPPNSSGLSTVVLNGGQFTNHGIELSFEASPVQMPRGLTWVTTTTFYRNYSRVDNLPIPPFTSGNQFGGVFGSYRVQTGRSVSEIVNTAVLGSDGNPVQVGDAQPAYVMSFNNEFTVGHVHLSGLVDWYRGGNVSNLTNAYFDNGLYLLKDSVASAKRIAAAGAGLTPYIESATFIKLREVTIGYDLPDRWFAHLSGGRVTSARLDVSGRNLFSSYKYSGLDPEVSNFGNSNINRGQDVTPFPPSKSVFVSVTLGL